MTENKREEILKDMRDGYFDTYDEPTMNEFYEQIEKEHKEIQQYRAVGTIEEFRKLKNLFGNSSIELSDIVRKILKEYPEYQSIGTIEELKILKEKNIPKKVIRLDNHDYYDYKCPTCGMPDKDCMGKKYCNCGQALDLSKED